MDIIFKKLAPVLAKQTQANHQIIELKNEKQPIYRLIYNLKLVELETLKIYMEKNVGQTPRYDVKNTKLYSNFISLKIL